MDRPPQPADSLLGTGTHYRADAGAAGCRHFVYVETFAAPPATAAAHHYAGAQGTDSPTGGRRSKSSNRGLPDPALSWRRTRNTTDTSSPITAFRLAGVAATRCCGPTCRSTGAPGLPGDALSRAVDHKVRGCHAAGRGEITALMGWISPARPIPPRTPTSRCAA